jgi:hypothetical protein
MLRPLRIRQRGLISWPKLEYFGVFLRHLRLAGLQIKLARDGQNHFFKKFYSHTSTILHTHYFINREKNRAIDGSDPSSRCDAIAFYCAVRSGNILITRKQSRQTKVHMPTLLHV